MESQSDTRNPAVEELQAQAMISEGGRVEPPKSAAERAKERWPRAEQDEAASERQPSRARWFAKPGRALSERLARSLLERLSLTGSASKSLADLPGRMHRVARQSGLVLELIDDFRSGAYRDVPWQSLAVACASALYSLSPADVIPDFLPLLGSLDDLALIAVATRWIERDLRAYCRFKGYDEEDYF